MRFAICFIALLPVAASAADRVIADPAASAACLKASGLDHPSISAPIRFSDAMGRSAMVMNGRRIGASGKAPGSPMLCLYDRHAGRAEARDMGPWSQPPRQ